VLADLYLRPGASGRDQVGHTSHVTRLRLAHMAGRRDPGSAIFLSPRLSSLRPALLGRPSEPSLRGGFASLDPASAHQEIGASDEDGEIIRRWAGRRGCSGPADNSGSARRHRRGSSASGTWPRP
jgi:hypothetical protein